MSFDPHREAISQVEIDANHYRQLPHSLKCDNQVIATLVNFYHDHSKKCCKLSALDMASLIFTIPVEKRSYLKGLIGELFGVEYLVQVLLFENELPEKLHMQFDVLFRRLVRAEQGELRRQLISEITTMWLSVPTHHVGTVFDIILASLSEAQLKEVRAQLRDVAEKVLHYQITKTPPYWMR